MLGLPFCCCSVIVAEARSCHDDTPTFSFSLPFFQGRKAFHRVCLELAAPRCCCCCCSCTSRRVAVSCRVCLLLFLAVALPRTCPPLLLYHPRPCLTNHHLIAGAARPAGASDVQHVAAIVRRAIRDPRSRFNC